MKGSDSVSYRKGLTKDLKLIYEMERKCFNEYDCLKPRQINWYLKNQFSSVLVDIIAADENDVGWASFFTRKNSKTIRLYSLCIIPEYGGRGYARQYLLKRMGDLSGYDKLVLEVRAGNEKAISLYKKLGFTIKKSLPGYYPDGEDGLKMIKIIR